MKISKCIGGNILGFFVFTYLFSWLCWLPFMVEMGIQPPDWLALVGVFGPSVMGLIFSVKEGGSSAIKELLTKCFQTRVHIK